MLRPSFKKYFHDGNSDDSDVEPALEAEPSLVSEKIEKAPSKLEPCKGGLTEGDPNWSSDRSIYEMQLNQLQEQLVETMLENQQLGNYQPILILKKKNQWTRL